MTPLVIQSLGGRKAFVNLFVYGVSNQILLIMHG